MFARLHAWYFLPMHWTNPPLCTLLFTVTLGCSGTTSHEKEHAPPMRQLSSSSKTDVAIPTVPPDNALPSRPSQSAPPIVIIIDRPIAFKTRRKQLTIEYRRIHQNPSSQSIEIEPKIIVLHYTAGNSADSTFNYFNKTEMSGSRAKLEKAGRVNVSAHFLVDRDGTIFRLVPENWMARHTIGLNHLAIGIENVGNAEDFPLTPEQVAANAALIRYLVGKHPITHLIGHSESMDMETHSYWLELDPNYRNQKADPGKEFMAKVRTRVADLELEGPPIRGQQ